MAKIAQPELRDFSGKKSLSLNCAIFRAKKQRSSG
jgi:hypothetical protein